MYVTTKYTHKMGLWLQWTDMMATPSPLPLTAVDSMYSHSHQQYISIGVCNNETYAQDGMLVAAMCTQSYQQLSQMKQETITTIGKVMHRRNGTTHYKNPAPKSTGTRL